MLITMSISSAPLFTASTASATFVAVEELPRGKPTTVQILTEGQWS